MPWDKDHPLISIKDSLGYKVCDMDEASNPRYYGMMDRDGWWLIIEENITAPASYRYVRGKDDYATQWGNRATLTYRYPSEVF